jgi:hypothetical protein
MFTKLFQRRRNCGVARLPAQTGIGRRRLEAAFIAGYMAAAMRCYGGARVQIDAVIAALVVAGCWSAPCYGAGCTSGRRVRLSQAVAAVPRPQRLHGFVTVFLIFATSSNSLHHAGIHAVTADQVWSRVITGITNPAGVRLIPAAPGTAWCWSWLAPSQPGVRVSCAQ